jgi:hypothetical protein
MKRRKWLTSPSSGQATINSQLRHPKLAACHSRAALGGVIEMTNIHCLKSEM